MTKNDILQALTDLSRSQGCYGRLVDTITDVELEYLEAQEFNDVVDLIMFLEG